MRRAIIVSLAFGLVALIALLLLASYPQRARSQSACPLPNCAFFDPLSVAHTNDPALTRTQGLDPVVWGTSRVTELSNVAQNELNLWWPSTLATCPNAPVEAPAVAICNDALTEASNVNDAHTFALQAFYPRVPFDFAGRTGTVQFQVDLLDQGIHGSWAQFAITDQPLPAPSNSNQGVDTVPRNGVIIAFDEQCQPGSACWDTGYNGRLTTGAITVIRNYVATSYYPGFPNSPGYAILGSVLGRYSSVGAPGALNTVQVQISATSIDVFASDPGSATLIPLTHLDLGGSPNPPLTFSRGLVWLENASYGPSLNNSFPNDHQIQWANLAFDGPVLPRDLGYDVPDSLTPSHGGVNLGYVAGPSGSAFTLPGMADPARASGALAELTWFDTTNTVPTVALNGGTPIVTPWPFDTAGYVWRTIAIPVPLSALHAGANTLVIADPAESADVANIDLILAGAGTPLGPTPTPSPSPSPSPTPRPTPPPSPTPAGTVIASCKEYTITTLGGQIIITCMN